MGIRTRKNWSKATKAAAMATLVTSLTMSVMAAPGLAAAADNAEKSYLKYYSDYSSKEEAYEGAYEINQQVVEEGTILLKNEDSVLPMTSQKYVTVFGKASIDPAGKATHETTLADSLREVGFAVNPAMESFYENDSLSPVPEQNASGAGGPGGGTVAPGWVPNETDPDNITDSLWATCNNYSDAAFVVLYREAGESRDSAMFAAREWAKTEERGAFAGVGDIPGDPENRWTREDGTPIEKIESFAHIDDTYLSLSQYEADLIAEVGQRFEDVVVILNVAGTLQPDFLVSGEDGYCDLSYYTSAKRQSISKVKIKGALWTGYSGDDGLKALGRIIRGEVNPSGHTVDTWAMDYRQDPTYLNFSIGSTSGATGSDARLYGVNRLSYDYDAALAQQQAVDAYSGSTNWKSSGDSAMGRNFEGAYGTLSSGIAISPAYYQVSYSEGIYIGYRYWETVAAEIAKSEAAVAWDNANNLYKTQEDIIDMTKTYAGGVEGAKEWYNDYVVYPLGYGLSYTQFSWDVEQLTKTTDLAAYGGEYGENEVKFKVTVTNTGSVAGKDVVELYYSAPYIEGGIEKAHVVLGDFAKTKLLQPGQSQTLTLSVRVYDLASFDMALGSDGKATDYTGGYKLDAGDYTFALCTDAHTLKDGKTVLEFDDSNYAYTYGSAEKAYTKDPDTKADVTTLFDDVTNGLYEYGNNNNIQDSSSTVIKELSRADFQGTFPKPIALESMVRDQDYFDVLSREILYNTGISGVGTKTDSVNPDYDDVYGDYTDSEWFKNAENIVYAEINEKGERVFANGVNKGKVIKTNATGSNEVEKILLYELTASDVEYGDETWTAFLSQLTIDEMLKLVGYGGYCTYFINDLGVPGTINPDGPESVGTAGTVVSNAGDNMLSSTWNEDLAYMRGRQAGNEGMWGDSGRRIGDTTINQSVAGWYAPGADTHRSPFGGRNNQYFSEDGVLGGRMVAQECQGARDMGMIVFIKHFALNDQEACRDFNGLITWATEQSMREIYLKNFEYALRGPALGTMTSLNRIGDNWTGYRYDVLTELLRGEWGFKGAVVTDGFNSWMDMNRMMRAGNDLALNMFGLSTPSDPFGSVTVEKLDSEGQVVRGDDGKILYETKDINSEVQIAALQETCLHILYAVSQSHSMLNGACLEYNTVFTQQDLGTYNAGDAIGRVTTNRDGSVTISGGQYVSFTDGDLFDVDISGYKITSGSLPEGLQMSSDGQIGGTISAEANGEYTFTVQARADGWGRKEKTVTITVNGVEPPEEVPPFEIGDNGNWFINGVDTGISATGPEGPQGPAGPEGPVGPAGETPVIEPVKGGCGSTVAMSGTFVMLSFMAVATIVVFAARKIKKNKNNE